VSAEVTRRQALALSQDDWQAELERLEQPAYRADQILEWIYQKRATSFEKMSNLPAALRQGLTEAMNFSLPVLEREVDSGDTTKKFLLRVGQGDLIETVLIPASPALYGEASDRRTLCVSSQVGCAYGCRFCASGLDGWKRHLSADEIVGQLLLAESVSGEKVNNIVFMGMGEPLANLPNLLKAIEIINAPWGIGLGARHITVSTSGLVPQIRELADQSRQIRLAISLHGATDEVRSKIMPVNRKYPLEELMEACEYFTHRKKQLITFEYILIDGINDAPAQARALSGLARPLKAKVNLIPYNTVEGLPWKRPPREQQEKFLMALRRAGVPATLRREKGHDIAAACGQLRLQTVREKNFASGGVI